MGVKAGCLRDDSPTLLGSAVSPGPKKVVVCETLGRSSEPIRSSVPPPAVTLLPGVGRRSSSAKGSPRPDAGPLARAAGAQKSCWSGSRRSGAADAVNSVYRRAGRRRFRPPSMHRRRRAPGCRVPGLPGSRPTPQGHARARSRLAQERAGGGAAAPTATLLLLLVSGRRMVARPPPPPPWPQCLRLESDCFCYCLGGKRRWGRRGGPGRGGGARVEPQSRERATGRSGAGGPRAVGGCGPRARGARDGRRGPRRAASVPWAKLRRNRGLGLHFNFLPARPSPAAASPARTARLYLRGAAADLGWENGNGAPPPPPRAAKRITRPGEGRGGAGAGPLRSPKGDWPGRPRSHPHLPLTGAGAEYQPGGGRGGKTRAASTEADPPEGRRNRRRRRADVREEGRDGPKSGEAKIRRKPPAASGWRQKRLPLPFSFPPSAHAPRWSTRCLPDRLTAGLSSRPRTPWRGDSKRLTDSAFSHQEYPAPSGPPRPHLRPRFSPRPSRPRPGPRPALPAPAHLSGRGPEPSRPPDEGRRTLRRAYS